MKQSQYKGFYNIVRNEAKKEATIFIYGVIGGFDYDKWEPINTANNFVEEFKEVEKAADVIHIKINTPGGNIWDGLPIYNVIKNSTSETKTYVDGIAYSMGALIALAGDTVYGYSNSMFMFHYGSSFVWGNAEDMRKEADTLDKYDLSLGTIIEEKLNISTEEVKEKYLDFNDNYFVGIEAKEIGFFDEIITSKKADIPEDVKDMSPKDLMKHYSAMNFKDHTPPKQKKQPIKTKNMSKPYPKIEAVLDKKFEDGEASNGILLAESEAQAVENKITSLEGDVATANTAKETAEGKITTMQEGVDAANAGFDTIVNEVNESLGLEGEAKTTDVAAAVAALNAKIADLGEQPGETHTTTNTNQGENKDAMPSYVDLECSIYKIK